MRIEWLTEARRNRDDQIDFIADRNPRVALAVDDAVQAAADRLIDFPESGPRGREPGTRELVVRNTPFIIVYRLETETVVILRLLHSSQDWPANTA